MRIFALTDASPSLTPANFSPKGRRKPKYEDFPLENLPTLFSIISYLLSSSLISANRRKAAHSLNLTVHEIGSSSLSSLHSLSVASKRNTFRFCLVPGVFIIFLYFTVGHLAKNSMFTYSRCSGDRLFFPVKPPLPLGRFEKNHISFLPCARFFHCFFIFRCRALGKKLNVHLFSLFGR